jgi:hypothetical protein
MFKSTFNIIFNRAYKRTFTTTTKKPLKIAFFGSDHFSVKSLSSIHEWCQLNENILHVITPPDKVRGRGILSPGNHINQYIFHLFYYFIMLFFIFFYLLLFFVLFYIVEVKKFALEHNIPVDSIPLKTDFRLTDYQV